jgi:Domain of unknown function (DUF4136)
MTVDFGHALSFQGFETYTWGKGTPVKNPLMDQRIVQAIDKQLAAKGITKVDPSTNPDLVVIYHAAVGTETELNTTNMGGWRWGGGVDKIPVGPLTVDIGDAKTKKLAWMGNASGTLSDNPEKNTKRINSAVEKMFKKFPPPPDKKK